MHHLPHVWLFAAMYILLAYVSLKQQRPPLMLWTADLACQCTPQGRLLSLKVHRGWDSFWDFLVRGSGVYFWVPGILGAVNTNGTNTVKETVLRAADRVVVSVSMSRDSLGKNCNVSVSSWPFAPKTNFWPNCAGQNNKWLNSTVAINGNVNGNVNVCTAKKFKHCNPTVTNHINI